jgi:hypothetical protein
MRLIHGFSDAISPPVYHHTKIKKMPFPVECLLPFPQAKQKTCLIFNAKKKNNTHY